MKKALSLFLILAMLTMLLASCGGNTDGTSTTGTSSTEDTSGSTGETEPVISYDKNLVMHLDFDSWEDGVVKDITGNGHDATAFGGASKAESCTGSSASSFLPKGLGTYFVFSAWGVG